jgi:NADH-quinone oxidoreductase subunit F
MIHETTPDLTLLEPVLARFEGGNRSDLLPALYAIQQVYGWLPEPALRALGKALRVPVSEIHGVVEFYSMFYNEPVGERVIRVCCDPSCAALGGEEVLAAACQRAGVKPGETTADGTFTVERATCLGLCDQGPAALVDDLPLANLTPEKVEALFTATAPTTTLRVSGEPRVLTARVGKIAPADANAHHAAGTFKPLQKALREMTPEQVIEEVKASSLVGRGGAGFPTGLKWQFTRGAGSDPKYVVCNADESEPGTFKDRLLLEGDPFAILMGMTICGYAIGAHQGYVFIRGEYPLAMKTMQAAIEAAYEAGVLGGNIFDSGFDFDIAIKVGAGAYICGEETALFEAIEGKRGYPRLKPPFPTTNGLFDKPTVINNVETLAAIPHIVANGGKWFQDFGTHNSAGLKLFCVSGHVNRPGVVEASFGLTLNELIEKYCGGFRGAPKAVLMGGAAGSFLAPEHIHTPLTFEDLRKHGAAIGSGAIMVFNHSVDLRRVLDTLGRFFAHESCGKCFPCQLGTQRQMEILSRLAAGRAQPVDRDLLMDIGGTMTDASICGLGQTAGTAVMSAIKLWPELFE